MQPELFEMDTTPNAISTIGTLNLRDLGKTLLLLVICSVLQALLVSIQGNGWHQILTSGFWQSLFDVDSKLVATYLLKNFFTDSNGKFLGAV